MYCSDAYFWLISITAHHNGQKNQPQSEAELFDFFHWARYMVSIICPNSLKCLDEMMQWQKCLHLENLHLSNSIDGLDT